jgi:iron(III) transport system permease protein
MSPLAAVAVIVAVLVLVPVAAVIAQMFGPATSTWAHLVSTVLPEYVRNTVLLLVGVGAGVALVGMLTS